MRAAAAKLVEVTVHPDDRTRSAVLTALDGLIRARAIAPFIPQMLDAKTNAVKDIGNQIVAMAEKFKINLPTMLGQYQHAITSGENNSVRCGRIVAGFVGLVSPLE